MDVALYLTQVSTAFSVLFVIMDPFVSIPVLLGISKGQSEEVLKKSADQATIVAGGLIIIFVFFGTVILSTLDIDINAFMIAGGIILMLLGLELVLGFSWSKEEDNKDVHAAAIVIGTPLITGPGVITTAIVYTNSFGYIVTFSAAILSIVITWIILRQAWRINRLLGPQVINVMSRIMGMLLVAMAIMFIYNGAVNLFHIHIAP